MDVRMPDGTVIRNVPAGTTRAQLQSKLNRARLMRENPGEYDPDSAEFKDRFGPTSGMSGLEKFGAGIGSGVADFARGAKQFSTSLGNAVGLGNIMPASFGDDEVARQRAEERDIRERNAPLKETGAGAAGSVAGSVATALPAMFIPGANTIAGSAIIGSALGGLQPTESAGERIENAALGGVLSPAGLMLGRGGAALWRGGKAFVEPLTKGGQQRIASRTLESFAGGREAAQDAAEAIARNRQNVLPGVQPTTAELADNAGIAQLERTLRNNPEYMTALTDRSQANRAAIVGTLDDIAGDDAARQAAVSARESAAAPLYKTAESVSAEATPALTQLLSRPSMQSAWKRAAQLASESGDVLDESELSGKTLHYLKMAMDDIADNPQASGIGAHEARAIRNTRNELVRQIEEQIPQYRQARQTYAELSRPINQMDVGQALRDKIQPALADFGATSRTRAEAFAKALREGDTTASKAVGRTAKLDEVMTPEQSRKLRLIAEQLARRTNADELGRSVGSPTAQNLVSQNVMRQFLGPLGMPESWTARAADSALMQTLLRPAQFVGKIGEERAMGRLAEAALDPEVAETLLRMGVPPEQLGLLRYQGMFGPLTVSGTNAAKE